MKTKESGGNEGKKRNAGRSHFDRTLNTLLQMTKMEDKLREFHEHPYEYRTVYDNLKKKYPIDYYDLGLKKAVPTDSVNVKTVGSYSDVVCEAAMDLALSPNERYDIPPFVRERLLVLEEIIEIYDIFLSHFWGDDEKILVGRLEGKSRYQISSEMNVGEPAVAKRLSRINKNFYNVVEIVCTMRQYDQEGGGEHDGD